MPSSHDVAPFCVPQNATCCADTLCDAGETCCGDYCCRSVSRSFFSRVNKLRRYSGYDLFHKPKQARMLPQRPELQLPRCAGLHRPRSPQLHQHLLPSQTVLSSQPPLLEILRICRLRLLCIANQQFRPRTKTDVSAKQHDDDSL